MVSTLSQDFTCTIHLSSSKYFDFHTGNRPVKKVNTTCIRRLTIAVVTVHKSAHKEKELKMTIVLQDT